MDVAGDGEREGAHPAAGERVARECLFQPFEDGKRLGERRGLADVERGHEALRVERAEPGPLLLALAEVVEGLPERHALEVQRDPHPPRRAGAEEAVQRHAAAPPIRRR